MISCGCSNRSIGPNPIIGPLSKQRGPPQLRDSWSYGVEVALETLNRPETEGEYLSTAVRVCVGPERKQGNLLPVSHFLPPPNLLVLNRPRRLLRHIKGSSRSNPIKQSIASISWCFILPWEVVAASLIRTLWRPRGPGSFWLGSTCVLRFCHPAHMSTMTRAGMQKPCHASRRITVVGLSSAVSWQRSNGKARY